MSVHSIFTCPFATGQVGMGPGVTRWEDPSNTDDQPGRNSGLSGGEVSDKMGNATLQHARTRVRRWRLNEFENHPSYFVSIDVGPLTTSSDFPARNHLKSSFDEQVQGLLAILDKETEMVDAFPMLRKIFGLHRLTANRLNEFELYSAHPSGAHAYLNVF